ncbi:CBS domain-containing protein [Colwellia sp. E2M01]|uniref:CBS domain-containing protein n=1 Tax=Colwellia sp. E2M01 TaxID=2841561 RepID=UPI001C0A48E4|nr:CBS domain-containing protein [Colwellia sp. E2M01]MBU2871506.1 CBS domain-containing protein [Colwellia sp. E2M01]
METLQVKNYMNNYPVTFTEKMSVEEASLRFLKTKQIGGPVIDENYKLLGFISERDVLKKMLDTLYFNENVAFIKDIMRKDVLSVKPYDSIIELGQNMLNNKPKVYPVIDDSGNLLGTICRNEVLEACYQYAQQRGNIEKVQASY